MLPLLLKDVMPLDISPLASLPSDPPQAQARLQKMLTLQIL
ncbi:MAG: hypothetical protein SFW65_03080 [Alphaproteobacteria bacterium]|nr:hypothetical protein [Alphaproteobacteria bacterium]